MKHKVRTIRIITATVLLVLAACLFVVAYVTWTELTRVGKAEPVNMAVDFSSPGKYSSSFRTTYRVPLGIRIQLKSDGELSGRKPRLPDLDGLEGQICITDNKGQVAIMQDFTAESFQRDLSMSVLFGKRQGKGWTISVDVTEPAPALRNTQQLLRARYLICGMEAMPTVLAVLAGLICTTVAIKIMWPKHKKFDRAGDGESHLNNVS